MFGFRDCFGANMVQGVGFRDFFLGCRVWVHQGLGQTAQKTSRVEIRSR